MYNGFKVTGMIEWGKNQYLKKSAGETRSITLRINCNTPLSIWRNVTVAMYVKLSDASRTDLTNTGPVDKADIKSKPTTVSEQLSLNLTILTLTCT